MIIADLTVSVIELKKSKAMNIHLHVFVRIYLLRIHKKSTENQIIGQRYSKFITKSN